MRIEKIDLRVMNGTSDENRRITILIADLVASHISRYFGRTIQVDQAAIRQSFFEMRRRLRRKSFAAAEAVF
jgi:hypothetical protein